MDIRSQDVCGGCSSQSSPVTMLATLADGRVVVVACDMWLVRRPAAIRAGKKAEIRAAFLEVREREQRSDGSGGGGGDDDYDDDEDEDEDDGSAHVHAH